MSSCTWFTIRCPSPRRYPASCCLRICVNGITAKTNSRGDRESHWNIPRLMLTLPSVIPPAVSSVLQLSMLYINSLLRLSAAPVLALPVPVSMSAVSCCIVSYKQIMPYSDWCAFVCSSSFAILSMSNGSFVPCQPFLLIHITPPPPPALVLSRCRRWC